MIIYKVTNKINNKCYIGQTIDLKTRKQHHIKDSKRGSDYHFHRAMQKYGIDNFEWTVICECKTKEELNEKEMFYIKEFKSNEPEYGYNMTLGGDGASPNEELRRRLSISGKNKIFTEEHKKNISISKTGSKHSEETKKKQSLSAKKRIRRPCPEEIKEKIRISNTGLKRTEETKRKMSLAKIGCIPWNKGLKKNK
jgi:group I intron endonuclease